MAHLLIVDNDERIVELTAWFLQRFGHEVDTAFSYAAARERLAARRPELMLADLDLGAESGREELPRLAAEGLLPPTLVVSGFLDAGLEEELLAVPGVLATLAKPVDLDALQERVLACVAAGAAAAADAARAAESAPAAAPVALQDEDDDDGWVEVVPLRADVAAAAAAREPAPMPTPPPVPAPSPGSIAAPSPGSAAAGSPAAGASTEPAAGSGPVATPPPPAAAPGSATKTALRAEEPRR